MVVARNDLPVELINAFWAEVEGILRKKHGLKGDLPLRAMLRYRNQVERIGSLLYHRSASDVAQGIVTGGYARN